MGNLSENANDDNPLFPFFTGGVLGIIGGEALLFGAQGYYGVEACGPHGGIIAEKYSD